MHISEEIKIIRERNARVESDKAWETSKVRRSLITVATYMTMVSFLHLIHAPNPLVNALVPALAYLLSTLSIPILKRWWLQNLYRK